MAKKFTLNSAYDVQALKDYLAKYSNSFENKIREVLNRLAYEVGIPTVDARYGAGMGDSSSEHSTLFTVAASGKSVTGTLTVNGKDVAFVEFGAGIHYNTAAGTSPHPKGEELGYTIGSYGQGQGKYDIWVYMDENGNRQVSYGTEATMPLYTAEKEMVGNLARICREVFANG